MTMIIWVSHEPFVDAENARRHREMDKSPTDAFYEEQRRLVSASLMGGKYGKKVRRGELPQFHLSKFRTLRLVGRPAE